MKSLNKRYYSGYKNSWRQFYKVVCTDLQTDYIILNTGCGKSGLTLRGRCKCRGITGIDFDQDILRNPDIDVPIVGDINR